MNINIFAMKHKIMKSILHDFEEKVSYVGANLVPKYEDSNALLSKNSVLRINYIHHKGK